MPLNVALQMDPIDSINITGDSSFVLGLEAERRGHQLWHYLPTDLALDRGRLFATARRLSLRRVKGDHFTLGTPERLDLSTLDVVLLRQDPPFDMGYITTTHLLDHIHPKTLVVNDPTSVRNAPEKLLVTRFPDLMPPTLITRRWDEIRAFRTEYKDIIVKPLFGNGGAGVFHIKPDDENLTALLEMFSSQNREPLMIQRYEPAVRAGDKRIILVDGEPKGAILRVPAAGEARANMHVGGVPVKTTLTPREREICTRIGPLLRAQGLIFVGIDVIGDWLTEINVTSPTGLQEVATLDGVHLEQALWDVIEARRAG